MRVPASDVARRPHATRQGVLIQSAQVKPFADLQLSLQPLLVIAVYDLVLIF